MKKIFVFASVLFMLNACQSGTENQSTETPAAAPAEVPKAAEEGSVLLPPSSTDIVKKAIEAYAAGDIATFTSNMDDNIKFYYPGPGDSLIGKQAVNDFYAKRRDVAESIQVVNPVFLGMKNNTNDAVAKGDWLMSWYTFVIKYKNGKSLALPIHTVQHMNAAGKADIMAMYYDMARVMQASK